MSISKTLKLLLATSCVLPLVACHGNSINFASDFFSNDFERFETSDGGFSTQSCTFVDEEIMEEEFTVVTEMVESYQEFINCGSMTAKMSESSSVAVENVVSNLALSQIPKDFRWTTKGLFPKQFEYLDNGQYNAGNSQGTVKMEVNFLEEQDVLKDDIYEFDNYLRNPKIAVAVPPISNFTQILDIGLQTITGDWPLTITYDKPGPLVKLLGYGDSPPDQIRLNMKQISQLNSKLEKLNTRSNIIINSENQARNRVHYRLQTDPTSKNKNTAFNTALNLEEFEFYDRRTRQSVETTSWDLDYRQSAFRSRGNLDGNMAFKVMSEGETDYTGEVMYQSSGEPTIRIKKDDRNLCFRKTSFRMD